MRFLRHTEATEDDGQIEICPPLSGMDSSLQTDEPIIHSKGLKEIKLGANSFIKAISCTYAIEESNVVLRYY